MNHARTICILTLICPCLLSAQEINAPSVRSEGLIAQVKQLQDDLKEMRGQYEKNRILDVPPGTVVAFVSTPEYVPAGWAICDGSAVPSEGGKFGRLYGIILETHGDGGDGPGKKFNLPDYRGRFMRGVDAPTTSTAAGRDPKAAERQAMASNGNSGAKVGSVQPDTFMSHNHTGNTVTEDIPPYPEKRFNLLRPVRKEDGKGTNHYPIGKDGWTAYQWNDNGGEHQHKILPEGGDETCPKNAYVNFIIKL